MNMSKENLRHSEFLAFCSVLTGCSPMVDHITTKELEEAIHILDITTIV